MIWMLMRQQLLAAALTVCAFGAGCSGSGPGGHAMPAVARSGDLLTFVADGPSRGLGVDNKEIFVVRATDERKWNVSNSTAAEGNPAWSPDGTRVVFTRQSASGRTNGEVRLTAGVYVATAGRPGARRIMSCAGYCEERDFAWSPDGAHIAFVTQKSVETVNADGTDLHAICASRCGQGLAGPQWSPDGTKLLFSNQDVIAFPSIGVLPSGIWVASADGSGVRKLTQLDCRPGTPKLVGCRFDSAPQWSPDGKLIAFSSYNQQLHGTPPGTSAVDVMNADGSSLHAVFRCGGDECAQVMAPQWSPSGAGLAFAPRYDRPAITFVTTSGHASTIRTCTAAHRCIDPVEIAWSPDGSTLGFLADTNPGGAWQIRRVGTGMRQVAPNVDCCLSWLARTSLPGPSAGRQHSQPSRLTANGTIAFTSDQASPGNENDQLYLLSPRTGRSNRLLTMRAYGSSWAPDGRHIVFAGARSDVNPNLFIVSRDGTQLRQLTSIGSGAHDPAWSPDGTTIAYDGNGIELVSAGGGTPRTLTGGTNPAWSPNGHSLALVRTMSPTQTALFTIGLSGDHPRQITNLPGEVSSPSWSPTGHWISFVWWTEGGNSLYLIRPDGSGLRRVTTTNVPTSAATWSPDGRFLAFPSSYSYHRTDINVADITTGRIHRIATVHGEVTSVAWAPAG
jgi:Tol biopolymer transport system component